MRNLNSPEKKQNDTNPIGSMEKWYIYLHEWLIFMVNVGYIGKYTSLMDPMGVVGLGDPPIIINVSFSQLLLGCKTSQPEFPRISY